MWTNSIGQVDLQFIARDNQESPAIPPSLSVSKSLFIALWPDDMFPVSHSNPMYPIFVLSRASRSPVVSVPAWMGGNRSVSQPSS